MGFKISVLEIEDFTRKSIQMVPLTSKNTEFHEGLPQLL